LLDTSIHTTEAFSPNIKILALRVHDSWRRDLISEGLEALPHYVHKVLASGPSKFN